MDYNKIIIALVIILIAVAVTGFVILNQTGNNTTNITTANNTTLISSSNTSTVEHLGYDSDVSNGGNYLEGPEVDSHGVTKEQVMRAGGDVKYDEEKGIYVQYDPKYGVYHD